MAQSVKNQRYKIQELLEIKEKTLSTLGQQKTIEPGQRTSIQQYPGMCEVTTSHHAFETGRDISRVEPAQPDNTDSPDKGLVHLESSSRPGVGWYLKGRLSSENSSQPLSAPSGHLAQKAENFQRFFRAVVSPTHIRVTAGGRIVPNTRTSIKPMVEWDEASSVLKSAHQQDALIPDGMAKVPALQSTSSCAPLSLPAQAPYQQFEPNVLRQHYPQSSASGAAHMSYRSARQVAEAYPHSAQPIAPGEQDGPHQGTINLSPPEAFDSTRPFLYKGRVVYPMPDGFQIPAHSQLLPINMLGNTRSPEPVQPQAPFAYVQSNMYAQQATRPPYAGNIVPSHALFQGQQAFGPYFSHGPFHKASGSLRNRGTIATAIAPTDYAGNAFLSPSYDSYNCENIPRGSTKVGYEGSGAENNASLPTLKSTERQQRDSNVLTAASANASKTQTSLHAEQIDNASAKMLEENTQGLSLEHRKGNEATIEGTIGILGESISTAQTLPLPETKSTSKLTAAAAKAPPFQPRLAFESDLQNRHQVPVPNASATKIENPWQHQLLHMHSDQARLESLSEKASVWATPPHLGLTTVMSQDDPQSAKSFNQTTMSNVTTPTYNSAIYTPIHDNIIVPSYIEAARPAAPYLMGYHPPGLDANESYPKHYLYARELTDDEKRARHLYWGNTPRELQKGLPKFDGKDFYPPSPPKPTSAPFLEGSKRRDGYFSQSDLNLSSHNKASPTKSHGEESSRLRAAASYEIDRKGFFFDDPTKTSASSSSDKDGGPASPSLSLRSQKMLSEDAGVSNRMPSGSLSPPKIGKISRADLDWIASHSESSEAVSTSTERFDPPIVKHENVAQNQSTFLQGMLRHAPHTQLASQPLSGALSSATALAYLPNFAGSAAASLGPTIASSSPSTGPSQRKPIHINTSLAQYNDGRAGEVSCQSRPDNQPPFHHNEVNATAVGYLGESVSATEYLRRLSHKSKESVDSFGSWDPKKAGTGPVMGSDW